MVVSVEPPGVERCPSTAGPGRARRCVGASVRRCVGGPVSRWIRRRRRRRPRRAPAGAQRSVRWFGGSFSDNKNMNVFVIVRWVWYWRFSGLTLRMIPRIHARDARFIPGGRERGWAGRGSRRGAVLLSRVRAASSRRRGRRLRRLRREAACCAREFESGGGGGCFGVGDDDGGSGGSDGSGGAGDSDCGVRARARPIERRHGPTWPIFEATDPAWRERRELGHGSWIRSGRERALAGATRGGACEKTGPRPPTCCEQ